MDQQGKVTANSSPMSAMSACFLLLSFALQCSALPRAQGASIDCGNPASSQSDEVLVRNSLHQLGRKWMNLKI